MADPRKRACQLMSMHHPGKQQVSYAERLALVRKQLHTEFPGLRNITRLIQSAVARQKREAPKPSWETRGRKPAASRMLKQDLSACCRAVKAGYVAHGQ